jgi:hypothetical protein
VSPVRKADRDGRRPARDLPQAMSFCHYKGTAHCPCEFSVYGRGSPCQI